MKKLKYFTAAWCAPCRMLKPVIQKLEREGKINVEYIDVDDNQELAARHDVLSVPTCFIMKDDEIVERFFGYKDADTIVELYNSV